MGMKFGFLTSVLGDESAEAVVGHAATLGFATLEVGCGSHLKELDKLDDLVRKATDLGVSINALNVPGTVLAPDFSAAATTRRRLTETLHAAASVGVPHVVSLCGRNPARSEADDYKELGEAVNVIVEAVAGQPVRLLFENWPGGRNDFLATTPAGWEQLFTLVSSEQVGLTFDPSHLVRLGIDHEVAYRNFSGKVYAIHGKDTEIFGDRVQKVGWQGRGWWTYRLPGRGRIDWHRMLNLLSSSGYQGPINIEHEDPDWGGSGQAPLDLRLRGLEAGLSFLRAVESLTGGSRA
jgi:sugar phosphate isomerase/epimerase